jgi:hypothetical protein
MVNVRIPVLSGSSRTEPVEFRGFPPFRQKQGERMGHGAFMEDPSRGRRILREDKKATTGIRAQHTMMDGTSGLEMEGKSARAHQIDNLERRTASATVKGEVNPDFDCCFAFSTAV